MAEYDIDPARLFHLNSSNVRGTPQDLMPDSEIAPPRRRIYPGARRVALPGADFELPAALGDLLAARRSIREFTLAPLPQLFLGRLLFATAAVTTEMMIEGFPAAGRPFPSGGGLYPLEIYPVVQQVEGIADGIYHYDPWTHELEERRPGAFHEQLASMMLGQSILAEANVILVATAIMERSMFKYGQRGYRYVWLEAGHFGQNVYLVAAALGLAPLALGGFYDAEVDALLELPPDENAIYGMCVGQRRS